MRPPGALLPEQDPILSLRNRLQGFDNAEHDEELSAPRRLALIIKGFNMWLMGKQLPKNRTLALRDNETYPRFEETPPPPVPTPAEDEAADD